MDVQSPWIRAEALIFDLEDTVLAPDKVAARALVREALERQQTRGRCEQCGFTTGTQASLAQCERRVGLEIGHGEIFPDPRNSHRHPSYQRRVYAYGRRPCLL